MHTFLCYVFYNVNKGIRINLDFNCKTILKISFFFCIRGQLINNSFIYTQVIMTTIIKNLKAALHSADKKIGQG